jgi:excisionase family DNA binding protein
MTNIESFNPNPSSLAHRGVDGPLRQLPRSPNSSRSAPKRPVHADRHGYQESDLSNFNSRALAVDLVAIIEGKCGAWSASELAELLGCSGKHIYALAKTGRMPHLRIGGMIRFDPRVTADWLRERSIAA